MNNNEKKTIKTSLITYVLLLLLLIIALIITIFNINKLFNIKNDSENHNITKSQLYNQEIYNFETQGIVLLKESSNRYRFKKKYISDIKELINYTIQNSEKYRIQYNGVDYKTANELSTLLSTIDLKKTYAMSGYWRNQDGYLTGITLEECIFELNNLSSIDMRTISYRLTDLYWLGPTENINEIDGLKVNINFNGKLNNNVKYKNVKSICDKLEKDIESNPNNTYNIRIENKLNESMIFIY